MRFCIINSFIMCFARFVKLIENLILCMCLVGYLKQAILIFNNHIFWLSYSLLYSQSTGYSATLFSPTLSHFQRPSLSFLLGDQNGEPSLEFGPRSRRPVAH